MVKKLLKLSSSPPPSLSPLHVSDYSLPASSRLPWFMIAAAGGFILMTTATYYLVKWFCFRKRCPRTSSEDPSDNSLTDEDTSWPTTPLPEPGEMQELRASKAHAKLGKGIHTSISTMSYAQLAELRSSAGKSKVESEACAICLGEFSSASAIKLLPTCTHAFHSTCIDLWLCAQASCPVCRANLFVVSP